MGWPRAVRGLLGVLIVGLGAVVAQDEEADLGDVVPPVPPPSAEDVPDVVDVPVQDAPEDVAQAPAAPPPPVPPPAPPAPPPAPVPPPAPPVPPPAPPVPPPATPPQEKPRAAPKPAAAPPVPKGQLELDRELYRAAEHGQLAAVQQALAAGANVHWVSRDGWRALGTAVVHHRGQYEEIVRVLLAARADPDHADDRGRTPLFSHRTRVWKTW
eukprot:SRR837773.3487.p1 GENE.SRR837773.3487~~SRR837773.3487.p1  ORF type:complete len:229 (-),score=17.55 SRR837773.3487:292-930(-)